MSEDLLRSLFAEILEVSPQDINDESSPENTKNWDSLHAMELVAAIEDTFHVALTTRDIMRMRSVGIVRQVLRSKGVDTV